MAKTRFSRTPQLAATRSPASQVVKPPPEPDESIDAPEETSAIAYQVATQNSALLTSNQVISLQHSVGNQAVTHLLQRAPAEGQTRANPVFGSPVVQLSHKERKSTRRNIKSKVTRKPKPR